MITLTPRCAHNAMDFTLPPDLEAHEPPEARGVGRDQVRLLVTERATDRIVHARFPDLPAFLRPGDLLVLNDSATLPAALDARRADGSAVALHLSTPVPPRLRDQHRDEPGRTVPYRREGGTAARIGVPRRDERTGLLYIVEPRQARVEAGDVLSLPGGGAVRFVATHPGSTRLWIARLVLPRPLLPYLAMHGRPIRYPYVSDEWPLEMYQTTYAREPGSAEMPSAGRAFTPEVLARVTGRGVRLARLTLHTGVASPERDEPPAEEWYRVPTETAALAEATRRCGGRVIAVGTTVVRALESAADVCGHIIALEDWTDLVVTPERGVPVVDGLLTGFHEPRASHLAMLEAFAGRAHLERAYRAALDAGYLWHEFGDLHLIL